MKTFTLLILLLIISACGQNSQSSSPKSRRSARNKSPVINDKNRTALRSINIAVKLHWRAIDLRTGEEAFLKCYGKSSYIKEVKFYSTNVRDTQRELISDPGQAQYSYVPKSGFGASLRRWPKFNRAGNEFRDQKKQIKRFCEGKSYLYIEDYKKNFPKGIHHIVMAIFYTDNTVFYDYQTITVR